MSQIQVDNIYNKEGDGAPSLPLGANVTGVVTATSFSGSGANLSFSGAAISAASGSFTGNVSIGGTLTYEDVTNIDSVGIITARDDINIVTDSKKLNIGAGADLQLYHDGNHSYIDDTGTGSLYIKTNNFMAIGSNGETMIQAAENSGVYLRFDNSIKLETTTGGVKVVGGYSETISAVSGTAVDCSTASYFTKTITGATTFTFTNVPSGVAYAFTFEVTLNGSNAITWPGTVKWPADTAPTITDGKTQVFVFLTDDGGARWRGSSLVDYTN